MPLFSRSGSLLGRVLGTAFRSTRLLLRGTLGSGRWMARRAGRVRERGAGGETGMMRLFDLHAVSCAGDTLITIGLAGTIFFNAPLGEARSKVALYLLVTMVPFALLAPVVGPLLDHFRHGRRYALAATMLGRAFLAWMISDYIHGFGLYPAAFGVLALSRAYGVARSAAVPRLLPAGLGLSQAGARASVYGTIAGAVVAPIGLAAFWLGPQWPLRVASVIFLVGMVIALRLPPRADSDPPETVPSPLRAVLIRGRRGERVLGRGEPSGRLVIATLLGAASLRALYGFLLLFLAFALKAGDLTTDLFGQDLGDEAALGVIGGTLAAGSFLATALGTRLRIPYPTTLQSAGLMVVASVAVLAALRFSLPMVALLCLVTAIVSGLGKLAVDASIQERVRERLRASSFAHSETALVLAFVAGGALGLIPFTGQVGVGAAAGFACVAAIRAVIVAGRLRGERLRGRAPADDDNSDRDGGGRAAEATRPTGAAGDDPTPPDPMVVPTSPAPAGSGSVASSPATQGHGTTIRSGEPVDPARSAPGSATPAARPEDDSSLAPPGYHIYRPSSALRRSGTDAENPGREQGR